jgi:hypothetical protein
MVIKIWKVEDSRATCLAVGGKRKSSHVQHASPEKKKKNLL